MAGTVKVPGIGPVGKKTLVFTGVGIGVIVIILYIRQRKASGSAASTPASASTSAGQQTDPAGNTGTIDPATGYVYGSAEDQQALAAAQSAYGAYNTSALGAGLGGYYYGPGGSTQASPPGPGNFADNAEWAQYAENYMISTLQTDPNTAGNALGKYITGQQVDASQQAIIEEAIAIAGQPPASGAGGYPPGIRLTASGSNATVPNVVGQAAGDAHNAIVAAGLVPIADPGQKPHDKVTSTSPSGGTSVAKGTRVLITASPSGSGGGSTVTVPDEAGKSAGQAHNDLVAAGLIPVAPPQQRPRMRVSHTNPSAGSQVPRGTRVTIATSGYVR